jgi:hypothetical protein
LEKGIGALDKKSEIGDLGNVFEGVDIENITDSGAQISTFAKHG